MLLRMDNSEKALQTHPVQLIILVQHPVDSPSHRNQSKLFEQTQQVCLLCCKSWSHLVTTPQCPLVPLPRVPADNWPIWILSDTDPEWGRHKLGRPTTVINKFIPKASLGKKPHKLLITFQQESPLMFLCWAAAAFTLRCLFHSSSSDENDASYNKLYK